MKFPRVNRRIGAGKHPLTKVFPGLGVDPAFVGIFPDGVHREVLEKCYIEAVAEDIHKDILKNLKYAVLWGASSKFEAQRVGRDHVVVEGDVVELHT